MCSRSSPGARAARSTAVTVVRPLTRSVRSSTGVSISIAFRDSASDVAAVKLSFLPVASASTWIDRACDSPLPTVFWPL